MTKENVAASEEKEEKSGLRIAQVLAAALAAVTAALLGSTLGVAGTVVGAGVASVVSTVGSELYLRSLQRTREAALRARQLATSGIRRRGGPAVDITEQPTVQLKPPEEEPSRLSARLRKLRWPLIIGTSVAAFAVAILSIVGFESATGTQIGGGTGSSIGKIFTGGSGRTGQTPSTTPPTSANDTQVSPTETTTSPTDTTTPPTTSSETPTTTPGTTTEQPSTSAPATTATPPTSKGAAATPTP
ncbi:hypothetical protein [Amycolatopsis kentuckyensis]|uniref:hypothetical protein n=1 Tax=Amycolatopsis kentuckyensis TaxID=218823 RepID=UPI000A3C3990|nr:hypothetical protein [Amycolatopsis kentuckyensis]